MLDNEHIEILYNLYGKYVVISYRMSSTKFFEMVIGKRPIIGLNYYNRTTFEYSHPTEFRLNRGSITFYDVCIKLNITNEMIVKFALENV